MNKCIFKGRLGNDPDMSELPNGTKIAKFSVAVTRSYKDKDGNRVTDWVPCTAWGPRAELIEKYFHKGSNILVETELQTSKYQDKESGKDRTGYTFNVLGIDFIDFNSNSSDTPQSDQMEKYPLSSKGGADVEVDEDDSNLPF